MRQGIVQLTVCILSMAAFAASAKAPAPVIVDGVMAYVNDRTILVSDVEKLVAPVVGKLAQVYSGTELRARLEEAYDQALQAMVDRAIILSKYEDPNPKAVNMLVEDRLDQVVKERFDGDRSVFLAALAKDQTTLNEWRGETRERTLASLIQQREIGGKVVVAPGAVWAAYNESRDKFTSADEVRMRIITVKKGVSEDDTGAKKAVAEGLKRRITMGEDFAAVAESFSDGAEGAKGGDTGWLRCRDLDPAVASAVRRLQSGEVSHVIETDQDYSIVKLEEKRGAYVEPIEDAWDLLESEIEKKEYDRLYDTWIRQLRTASYVRILAK